MMHNDWTKFQFFQQDIIENALQNNPKGITQTRLKEASASAYNNLGYISEGKGDIELALEHYNKSLSIKKEINDKKGLGNGYNNVGFIYDSQGRTKLALEYYDKSLKIFEELEDIAGQANCFNNIGGIHDKQGDYHMALNYYNKSLKIREESNDLLGMAISYHNVGHIHFNQGDHTSALRYFEKSLDIRKNIGDKQGMAYSFNNIGNIHYIDGDIELAIDYYDKSLAIYKESGDKKGMAASYFNIGSIERDSYEKTGDKSWLTKAKVNGLTSMKLAEEVGYPGKIKSAALLLYDIAKDESDYQNALKMYELYIDTRDSIESEENIKAAIRQNYQYTYEKQVAEDEKIAIADSILTADAYKVHNALLTAEKAENARQKQQSYFLYGGLGLALLLGGFILNRLKTTRKQKGIIEEAHYELEERNQEILDSIVYAKRIQNAILPPKKVVTKYLPQSFILYKPKDIVAGDFYWLEHSKDQIFFAAADCTGHGVPGAMVSVVCNNGLNRSVREYGLTDPGEILNRTRDIIIQEFEKSEEDVMDGMDIALCSLKDMQLEYSGANNPLWVIRNGEIIETKANKQPIGKYVNPKPFTTHSIGLQKGDSIYIFTDGFVDQFGGEKGKKFKLANFRKLLLSVQDKTMEKQHKCLDKAFLEWTGNHEQIDDVCVIGIKV